jgi:environmental stress-induced protein Ves
VQVLRAADRTPTPWKNGGGITCEVAVEPPGAGFADFGWRVSTAVVASDGPFSRFEGIDRTLVVLEGAGLTLDIAGQAVALVPGSDPFEFDGAASVSAALAAGPILDLNVMVRRGAWTRRVARRRLAAGARLVGSAASLVFALDETALETGRGEVLLAPKDALMLTAGEHAKIAARATPAALIVAEFHRVA